MPFGLIEPLRDLFKDEVRRIGRELGFPEEILVETSFPRTGVCRRVTWRNHPGKAGDVAGADVVVVEEIRHAGLYEKVWQAFAVLLPVEA